MLRLHVAELLPWVDSTGGIRTPDEEFSFLADENRLALLRPPTQFVGWKVGILSDDWEHPAYSKPVVVGDEDGSPFTAASYAIGDEAEYYFTEFKPLLLSVLRFLRREHSSDRWFLADSFWNPLKTVDHPPEERLLSFDQALQQGLVEAEGMKLVQLPNSRLFTGRPTCGQAARLFESWWPSTAAGFLGGVMTQPGFSSYADQILVRRGVLPLEAVPHIACVFRVSRSFDHLGLSILSPTSSWPLLRDELCNRGWIDGTPVDFLAPLTE